MPWIAHSCSYYCPLVVLFAQLQLQLLHCVQRRSLSIYTAEDEHRVIGSRCNATRPRTVETRDTGPCILFRAIQLTAYMTGNTTDTASNNNFALERKEHFQKLRYEKIC